MMTCASRNVTRVSTTYFLKDGVAIPRIGLGTAGFIGADVVETALNAGYSLIDTAQAPEWYSERFVGEGILTYVRESGVSSTSRVAAVGPKLFMITKIHPRSFARASLRESLTVSKELLLPHRAGGLLDLVLIHSPYCWPGHCTSAELKYTWEECWRHLERYKSEGKLFQNMGVSNFDVYHLHRVSTMTNMRITLVQNWCDPFHQDKDVRAFATANDIAYMAYSSFGTQWSAAFDQNPVSNSPALLGIGSKHNCTVYEVVISWLLQGDVIVIPRSTKVHHLAQNIFTRRRHESGPFEWYECFLDDEDMMIIKSLDGTLGTPWN